MHAQLTRCALPAPQFLATVAPYLAKGEQPSGEGAAAMAGLSASDAAALDAVVRGFRSSLKDFALSNPDAVNQFLATPLLDNAGRQAPDAHWAAVACAIQTTAAQREEVAGAYALFQQQLQDVLRERADLLQRIARLLPGRFDSLPLCESALPGHASSQRRPPHHAAPLGAVPPPGTAQQQGFPYAEPAGCSPLECSVALEQLSEQLERNVRKEGAAHQLLRGIVFGHSLTTLQFACLALHSFPFPPDASQIARHVCLMLAADRQQQQAAMGDAVPPAALCV